MKSIFKITLLLASLVSITTTAQTTEKETVSKFLETHRGVRHDIKLQFKEFEVFTVTVADSIHILQEKFQNKRAKKLTSLEKQIESYQKRINQKKETPGAADKVVESALQKRYAYDLAKLQVKYEKAKLWKPDYLNTYEDVDPTKALIKKANAVFTAQKPGEKLPALYRGTFILSLDGTKCYKMIRFPKPKE